jgi:hypothetical protein
MTPTASVAADIDAILLHALIDQTPIPGYGVDGLVAYITARHPTVPRALIETVLPGILAAHITRALSTGVGEAEPPRVTHREPGRVTYREHPGSGPCRAGLPRARVRPPWNAPAGLTAGSRTGRETGFAPI